MKLVLISDTHLNLVKNLPIGDVLVHCGDWSGRGSLVDLQIFCNQIKIYKQQFKHVLCVPGNHDWNAYDHGPLTKLSIEEAGGVYLHDAEIIIDGVKFYGSGWQPAFCDWAFNLPRGQALQDKWDMIPDDVEVLLTHSPPHGILDKLDEHGSVPGEHVGCWNLKNTIVSRLKKLKVNSFGHIHCNGGRIDIQNGVTYVNAAVLNEEYKQKQLPIVVEI